MTTCDHVNRGWLSCVHENKGWYYSTLCHMKNTGPQAAQAQAVAVLRNSDHDENKSFMG